MQKIRQSAFITRYLFPLLIFLAVGALLLPLVSTQLFGWDESVYLAKAKSWIESTPANQFIIYRPIGMAVVGWVMLHISSLEEVVRLFGVFFGAVGAVAIYFLAKKISGSLLVGLSSVFVLATSTLFLKEAPQFFNDIPAAALIVSVLWLIFDNFKKQGSGSLIYAAPVLASAAFYLRYGTITTLALIGLASLVLLIPKLEKNEDASHSKMLISAGIFALLMLPFFIYSQVQLGSYLGILSLGNKAAGHDYLGQGLIDYLKWIPIELGGWLLGAAVLGGVLTTLVIVARKKLRNKHIGIAWIGLIGIADLLVKGIFVHAEPRYIIFPVILLAISGLAGTHLIIKKYLPKASPWLFTSIMLTASLYGLSSFTTVSKFYQTRDSDPYNVAYLDAAIAIKNDTAHGGDCVLWSVASRPTLAFYAECNAVPVLDIDKYQTDSGIYQNQAQYSVVFTKRKEKQISPETAENFNVALTKIFETNNLSDSFQGNVIVYRISPQE